MSNLRILYLEASEADADSIASIVNIVREAQSGRVVTSVERFAKPLELPPSAPAAETDSPPLKPPATNLPKPREPRATSGEPATKSVRASNAGATILAALRKNPRPDRPKLATAIYGDASKTAKVGQLLAYLTSNGKLKNNGDGTYTVTG